MAIALLSFIQGTPVSGMHWLGASAAIAAIVFNVLAFRKKKAPS
jgi:hypothetical protein